MTHPTPNLNGTARHSLAQHYDETRARLEHAIDAAAETAPHPRDYPCGNYEAARKEHYERVAALRRVADEFVALVERTLE